MNVVLRAPRYAGIGLVYVGPKLYMTNDFSN